jgi:hypothetical protein
LLAAPVQADVLMVVPMRWPLVLTVGAVAACGGGGGGACSTRSGGFSTGLSCSGWRGGVACWTAVLLLEATVLTAMMNSHLVL